MLKTHRLDLVTNEEHVMLLAQLMTLRQIAVIWHDDTVYTRMERINVLLPATRTVDYSPGLALDGLHQEGRDVLAVSF